ncbi:MAG: hypothetical protein ABSF22_01580 [Bryobacteraceae bacterium]|jgi:hypothetical protein
MRKIEEMILIVILSLLAALHGTQFVLVAFNEVLIALIHLLPTLKELVELLRTLL